MAYLSTELGFDTGARGYRTEGVAILARFARRMAALQRKARRDRHVVRMVSEYDARMLADVGIDPRKARRLDWVSVLSRMIQPG